MLNTKILHTPDIWLWISGHDCRVVDVEGVVAVLDVGDEWTECSGDQTALKPPTLTATHTGPNIHERALQAGRETVF